MTSDNDKGRVEEKTSLDDMTDEEIKQLEADKGKICFCSGCDKMHPDYSFVMDTETSEHFGHVATHRITWAESDCCREVVVDRDGDGIQEYDGY